MCVFGVQMLVWDVLVWPARRHDVRISVGSHERAESGHRASGHTTWRGAAEAAADQ